MNLLLLHGALGTRQQLEPLKQALLFSEVRSLEFAGHGDRPLSDAGIQIEDLLQNIDDEIQAAGWSEAHLFGYSMGGYAALLYAGGHPEKVRSVVTLGTKLKWDREGLDRELRMLDSQKMMEKVPQFVMELREQHGVDKWESLVHETAKFITGLHERPPLNEATFANVKCPVLLCVGDRDRTAVPEQTLEVARSIPKAGTLVLPGTGHPFGTVDHKVFLPHLRAFWEAS